MPVDMKNIIAKTFLALTKQRGIDKITVKSLIDECNISRQTFYYHFQDLMEVMEWIMEQAIEKTIARSLKAATPQEALHELIASAVENRTLICKLLDSQKWHQMETLFVKGTRTYLQEMFRGRPHALSLSYADMEVALDFWAFGISGLLFQYCRAGSVDAAQLAAQICNLLPGEAGQGGATNA